MSKKLGKSDVALFHPALFKRAIKKAKLNASTTVGIGTVPHPDYTLKVMAEEYAIWNEVYDPRNNKEHNAHVLSQFDYWIAISDFMKETYVNAGLPSERIYVASLDIDSHRFTPDESKKNDDMFTVVFSTSSLPLWKGLQYLVDAWQKVNIENKKLLILGEKKGWPKELETRINEIIKQDVTIEEKGVVSNPENYLRIADVVVHPSFAEGFGKTILEAMACEKPVIVTKNSCGLVEDGKTGFVVPKQDSEAIREKIEYLYYHSETRKKMGKEARKAVLEKKSFGDAVYEIYKEIMKREGK